MSSVRQYGLLLVPSPKPDTLRTHFTVCALSTRHHTLTLETQTQRYNEEEPKQPLHARRTSFSHQEAPQLVHNSFSTDTLDLRCQKQTMTSRPPIAAATAGAGAGSLDPFDPIDSGSEKSESESESSMDSNDSFFEDKIDPSLIPRLVPKPGVVPKF